MQYDKKQKRLVITPDDFYKLSFNGIPVLSIIRQAAEHYAKQKNIAIDAGSVAKVSGEITVEYFNTLEELYE
jgi:hypothetical protein